MGGGGMRKPGRLGICSKGQGPGSSFFVQRTIAERSLVALLKWLVTRYDDTGRRKIVND
jgi:hypothetical protein